jgi:hypothetical protein
VTNRDFRDLFSTFAAFEVRFLVVGGYAVAFHAEPRYTKDLDVWIDPEPGNARRAWKALAAFGAPMADLREGDLSDPGMVFQMGLPPNRIDILTSIEGLAFPEAWSRRALSKYADVEIAYLSRADLIVNKRAVGRPQDDLDVQRLEED